MIPYKEEEEPEMDQPKYLNENALIYPQTAIRALIDESKRLFEGPTFEIITHGLNLHRDDIKSEIKLKKMVKSSKEDMNIDVEELYYQKVKTIYSKIIKYGTRIQANFSLSHKKMEAVTNIKLANRYIVEAIKDLIGLQKNVSEYMVSDNKEMEKEYDKLRKKISRVLREIYQTRKDKNPKSHLKDLEELKERARKSDALLDGTLDKLIRKNLITSSMATSLANDSNIVAEISANLIKAAELLYIDSDTILESLPKLNKKQRKNLEELEKNGN